MAENQWCVKAKPQTDACMCARVEPTIQIRVLSHDFGEHVYNTLHTWSFHCLQGGASLCVSTAEAYSRLGYSTSHTPAGWSQDCCINH